MLSISSVFYVAMLVQVCASKKHITIIDGVLFTVQHLWQITKVWDCFCHNTLLLLYKNKNVIYYIIYSNQHWWDQQTTLLPLDHKTTQLTIMVLSCYHHGPDEHCCVMNGGYVAAMTYISGKD